jgi:hypothetical protein
MGLSRTGSNPFAKIEVADQKQAPCAAGALNALTLLVVVHKIITTSAVKGR